MASKARAYARQARADYDAYLASGEVEPASHSFAIVRALRYDPRSVTAVRLLGRLIQAADLVLA